MRRDVDKFMAKLRTAKADLERIAEGEGPTPEDLANAPRLDFWSVGEDAGYPILQGMVSGHPRLADGDMIQTSTLVWLSEDRRLARTLSRFYILGASLEDSLRSSG